MSADTLDAVEQALRDQTEADDALRVAVGLLLREEAIVWAGIAFLEDGVLTLGPASGEPEAARRTRVPIAYQGTQVGELWVDGDPERSLLEGVAALLPTHVLVGWDTGGERWEP